MLISLPAKSPDKIFFPFKSTIVKVPSYVASAAKIDMISLAGFGYKINGVEFYAVNSSFEGEIFDHSQASRKIDADLFIDDRNLGGFPGWGEIYNIINERIEFRVEGSEVLAYSKMKKDKKKGLFW